MVHWGKSQKVFHWQSPSLSLALHKLNSASVDNKYQQNFLCSLMTLSQPRMTSWLRNLRHQLDLLVQWLWVVSSRKNPIEPKSLLLTQPASPRGCWLCLSSRAPARRCSVREDPAFEGKEWIRVHQLWTHPDRTSVRYDRLLAFRKVQLQWLLSSREHVL